MELSGYSLIVLFVFIARLFISIAQKVRLSLNVRTAYFLFLFNQPRFCHLSFSLHGSPRQGIVRFPYMRTQSNILYI